MNNIVYKNTVPSTEAIVELFDNADYFPFEDRHNLFRIREMFEKATLVIAAWDEEKLVGISRSLTDFCYCCYLSDLAVRNEYKGKGIGRKIVELTKASAGEQCKLILHASPGSVDFYAKIGMEHIDSAFMIRRSY